MRQHHLHPLPLAVACAVVVVGSACSKKMQFVHGAKSTFYRSMVQGAQFHHFMARDTVLLSKVKSGSVDRWTENSMRRRSGGWTSWRRSARWT